MAKTYVEFYDYVLPEVPGCPQDLAKQYIRAATIEFYERTGVLVYTAAALTIVDGTHTYTPAAPAGYEIARIEELYYGDAWVEPKSNVQLAELYQNWQEEEGEPRYFLQETTTTFRVVPIPDQNYTDTLKPRVVLRPTRSGTQISEDWVYNKWVEVIAAGALARLQQMPQKPWKDLEQAAINYRKFQAGIATATVDTNRSLTGAKLQVRLRRNF